MATSTYSYKVRNQEGKVIKGKIEAETREGVVTKLIAQGFVVLEVEDKKGLSKDVNLNLTFLQKVTNRDLAVFTRQLSTMVGAGLPILRSLSILEEQCENVKLQGAIGGVRKEVMEGVPLWEALNHQKQVFPNLYVQLVRSGELGGILQQVLERLTNHLEREYEITSKIKSASTYPAVVGCFAIGVVIFMLVYILPQFVGILSGSGQELPATTKALLGMSSFLKNFWWLLVIIIILAILGVKKWRTTSDGRYFTDKLKMKMPGFGVASTKLSVARFTQTMGTLVKSGISIMDALGVSEEVVNQEVLARAIAKARLSIREGETIAAPLSETKVFEPMVIQMISVGEETGTLDDMLAKVAEYYEKEVGYLIESIMSLIEPLLIIVMAFVVGFIMMSILLPMYQMYTTVGF
ncbi:MAG: type II secretion system F family protein [Chitinophagales bacterium]